MEECWRVSRRSTARNQIITCDGEGGRIQGALLRNYDVCLRFAIQSAFSHPPWQRSTVLVLYMYIVWLASTVRPLYLSIPCRGHSNPS